MKDRTIRFRDGGTIELPNVEQHGVIRLGSWVKPSEIPGTPKWEWVITNMPVTAVTGMSSGYTRTRWGARRQRDRALRFWASYGYAVEAEQ